MSGAAVSERSATITVPVVLADRSYDIVIGAGLVDEAGARIARLRPGAAVAVVTDDAVAPLHLKRLAGALSAAGIRASAIVDPRRRRIKELPHTRNNRRRHPRCEDRAR